MADCFSLRKPLHILQNPQTRDQRKQAPFWQSMHEHTRRFNHTYRQRVLKLAYACRSGAEVKFDFCEAPGMNAFGTWFGGLHWYYSRQ